MTTTPAILCADADRQLCRILEKALGGSGYRVVTAYDGDEAIEVLRGGEIQLALLDIGLPRLDGFAVLESLRSMPEPVASTVALMMSAGQPTREAKRLTEKLGAAALLSKPIPLKKLLAMIEQHLKSGTPAVAVESRARVSSTPDAPLVGSFKELPFPQLLHHLHGLRATGVLLLEAGKKKKALQLRDGYPVAVKSNLINECLGNLLVRRGKLDTDTLQESLRRLKRGEGLQGEILVAMHVLSEDEIPAALREQAEGKLFEIFSWKTGRFRFEIGGRLKRGTSLALDRSPADLIVGGVRSALPIERLDKFFVHNGARYLGLAQSPFYRFQDVELSESEEAAFTQIRSSAHRLGDFVDADETLRRTLYGMLVTGLLELRDHPPADELEASQPDEPTDEAESDRVDGFKLDSEGERALRTDLAATAERLRRLDPFAALGVSELADQEEVEAAYGELARRHHPDRFRSASSAVRQLADEVFQLLSKAREVLVEPKRREQYEHERKSDRQREIDREEGKAALEAEMEFQTGEARLRQRDYEGALACFGAAVTRFPQEGEYHALYGWTLYLCHPDNSVMVQEAIEHVRRGVQLARDREKPYLYLGRLYKVIGRGAAAEKMFTRALEISPDCVEALRELRLINLRRQKRGLLGRLFRR